MLSKLRMSKKIEKPRKSEKITDKTEL